MRIRRNASRLLGSAVSAPPRFELPPPPPFEDELPPPAHESDAGFACKTSSSPSPETCVESFSPWDLMDHLDLSDPQEDERFMEAYSVPVAWRTSCMPASSIKDMEEEDMAVDMVNGPVILEPCVAVAKKNNALGKTVRKKKESKPKTKKREEEEHESGSGRAKEESGAGGGEGDRVWTCKKNNGKGWICGRPVSQPDAALCPYHAAYQRPSCRKRVVADVGMNEEFYFYAGFGPSRGTKRRRRSSSGTLQPEPQLAADQQEDAQQLPEDVTTGQTQDEGTADSQVAAPACLDDEPRWDDDGMADGIAGGDEEMSSDEDYMLACKGGPAHDVKSRKSPLRKRWKKPVRARSINSLI